MKDLVISARTMRRELALAGICLLLALLVNAGAIVAYKTRWIELLTTFHLTLLLALLLYAVSASLRLLGAGLRRLVPAGPRRIAPDAPGGSSSTRGGGASVPEPPARASAREGAPDADAETPARS